MRSVSDLCIPDEVHNAMRGRGWGIVHAKAMGFAGHPDENLWEYARRERRVLLTADYDFHQPYIYPLNNHPGCIIIQIRRGIRPGERIADLMIRILTSSLPYLPSFTGMRESRVYLDPISGVQILRDGSRRLLYRST